MKFEEKKLLKKEEIRALFKGLGDLVEKDELSFEGHILQVPDFADVEIEYKEKKGRAKLEIEVEWDVEGVYSKEKQGREKTAKSDVKQQLKKVFNSIIDSIQVGRMPPNDEVESFVVLSKSFERLFGGKGYDKELEEFTSLIARFSSVAESGRTDEAEPLIGEIMKAKKSCHKNYIKK